MLLLIDNFDSFTYNLARYFIELGQDVEVRRNDQICCAQIAALNPKYLVFSPGPCTPNSAGITLAAIKQFSGKIPILGVCLGHQAIGQTFGANVVAAKQIKHGKTSKIYHANSSLFVDIPTPFMATRYHSLVLDPKTIPNEFKVSAWCKSDLSETDLMDENSEIMGIEHNTLPLFGVQFHPESLLTEFGHKILNNFLQITR
jgi:anthranilate synthase/aminodeoxychorismate synthase-like glutamine amidotransferase